MPSGEQYRSARRYTPSQGGKTGAGVTGGGVLLFAFVVLIAGVVHMAQGHLLPFAAGVGAFGCSVYAFSQLRQGVLAQKEPAAHPLQASQKPKLKAFIALMAALGLAATLPGGYTLIESVALLASLAIGWALYYGWDPVQSKPADPQAQKEAAKAFEALRERQEKLAKLHTLSGALEDASVRSALEAVLEAYEALVHQLQQEYSDYTHSKRVLGSYLDELMTMSERYRSLETGGGADVLRADFIAMLNDLHAAVHASQKKLLEEDKLHLDVEISVLKQRMQNEH